MRSLTTIPEPAFLRATTAEEDAVRPATGETFGDGPLEEGAEVFARVFVPGLVEPQSMDGVRWEALQRARIPAALVVACGLLLIVPSVVLRLAAGVVAVGSAVVGVWLYVSHERSQSLVRVTSEGLEVLRFGAWNTRYSALRIGPPGAIHSVDVWSDVVFEKRASQGAKCVECSHALRKVQFFGIRVLYVPPSWAKREGNAVGVEVGRGALREVQVFDPEAGGGRPMRLEAGGEQEKEVKMHMELWEAARQIRAALKTAREGREVGGDDRPAEVAVQQIQASLRDAETTVNPLEDV